MFQVDMEPEKAKGKDKKDWSKGKELFSLFADTVEISVFTHWLEGILSWGTLTSSRQPVFNNNYKQV